MSRKPIKPLKSISPRARANDAAIRLYLARDRLESQVRELRRRVAKHSNGLVVGGGFFSGVLVSILPPRSMKRVAMTAFNVGAVVLQSIAAPFLMTATNKLADSARKLVDRTAP